ncbi:MAG: class I SAM-dependent methyltransferase [Patescibacteria group bacterium]|nr:class I SAM-dependent methyltransferase [Patescibacteria group bacterium]MDD4304288.1 class I SAM-dependent methyltransferase [Patescibacteria group bacterium]MDD4695685.1 class I SAM-dependent methyltransferase [Patescibacteria group bacterium]
MKEEKEIYNELHKIWDSGHNSGSPTYLVRKQLLDKQIKKILNNKVSVKILDLGCGTGDYIKTFEKYNIDYTGLDLSDYAIEKLKQKYKSYKFICDDLLKIEGNSKYDLIFMSEVLEHIENENLFLEKIYTLLNNNGILILSVPYDPKLWNYSDEQAQHKRRYTKKYLNDKLKENKFKPINLICYGFPFLRIYWFLTKNYRKNIQTRKYNKHSLLIKIIGKIFLLDKLFIKTNYGIGLISISKKN